VVLSVLFMGDNKVDNGKVFWYFLLGFISVLIIGISYFGISSYMEQRDRLGYYSIGAADVREDVNDINQARQAIVVSEKISDDVLVSFDKNENAEVDLSAIEILRNDESALVGFVIVKNVKLDEDETKSVYLDIVSGSGEVCLKDEDVGSVDEISDDCSGKGEILISCPGVVGGYSCRYSNDQYEVSGLSHSGVREMISAGADNKSLHISAYWVATGAYGNHWDEVSGKLTAAHVTPEFVASSNGDTKLIVDVFWYLFDMQGGLSPQIDENLNSLESMLAGQENKILAFYVFDEPYITGHNTPRSVLETGIAKLKERFPDTPTYITFGLHCFDPEFSYSVCSVPANERGVPSNVDWVSFDWYYGSYNDAPRSCGTDIESHFQCHIVDGVSRLEVLHDGDIWLTGEALTLFTRDEATLVELAHKYFNLANSRPRVIGIDFFVWPDIPPENFLGLVSMPTLRNVVEGFALNVRGGEIVANVTVANVTVANNVNMVPVGWLDSADCDVVKGWTCDANDYGAQLDVHLYEGGGYLVGTLLGVVKADVYRADLLGVCGGNGYHGFNFVVPDLLKDGKSHDVYAYAINVPRNDNGNPLLNGAPRTINCCAVTSWYPTADTVCSGTSFTQTSNCGSTRVVDGIKSCSVACIDNSWTPATNTVCSGTSFTQTSNCGTIRSATGTKTTGECCVASSWTPATDTICSGTSFTQTSNCGSTRVVDGIKSCSVACASHASFSCSGGNVYWYNSCGARESIKKSCYLDYDRGGCWEGYCVRKMTRHTSSKYEDHMVSPCGLLNVCETSFFSDYGPAEIAFYLLNDEDYPSNLRIALYRKAKEYSSVDMDHLVTTSSAEAGDYNLEGLLGYALRYGEVGTSPLYRMRLNEGGGHDHMVSFSTTEGSPRYVYEGPLGHVITSMVSV